MIVGGIIVLGKNKLSGIYINESSTIISFEPDESASSYPTFLLFPPTVPQINGFCPYKNQCKNLRWNR